MKLAHRLLYFSGGFLLGILLLFFILSGKKTSCAYGPEARTLKNIRQKERVFTEATLQTLHENQLDTSAISFILNKGEVVFSESNIKMDSCNQYVLKGKVSNIKLKIKVRNCNKVATFYDALVEKQE